MRRLFASMTAGSAIIVVGACTTFSEDTPPNDDGGSSEAAEGASPADATTDAGDGDVVTTRCDRKAPFTTKNKVDGVNTPAHEAVARLTPDELSIYFGRDGTTIYRATRTDRTKAFDKAVPLLELGNTSSRHPWISPDERAIVFSRINPAGTATELVGAVRGSAGEPFGSLKPIAILLGVSAITAPFVSLPSRTLYFSAVPPVGGTYDVYSAPFGLDGTAGAAAPVDALNTLKWDGEPVVSADENTIYFYSERDRPSTAGEIWVSYRDGPGESFRTPTRVSELAPPNATSHTDPSWLSPDDCRLYYYANDDPNVGAELWVAERQPP